MAHTKPALHSGEPQAKPVSRKVALRQELDTLLNGRYHVNSELNSGATATVFSGVDLRNNLKVAIKVLNNLGQDGHSREQQQEVINMAEREATFASQFRHRHVVSLLHVIIDSPDRERVILVYDLVEGVELFDLVNSQPDCHLPEGRCRRYFRQLCMAVEYIHERGVAHRDIKPENCMIQRSTDHLKLIDFGFTSNVNSCRTLMVGTPDYMAPELVALETYGHGIIPPAGRRLKAEHSYDAKAVDVWSMGALLYIITVGCFPFEDSRKPNDMTWTLAKVRRGEFNRPPLRCSQELCDLFVCMFKVNPSKRITIEQLRGHPWMTCAAEIKTIDEQPVSAPPPTAAPKPAPPPYTSAALAATVQAMAQSQPKQQEKMGRVAPAVQPVPPPAVEDVKKSPRHGLGFLNFGMRNMAVSSPTSSPSSSPRVSASDAATGSSNARGQEGQASKRTRPAWLQPKS